jgi:hypothetical protein
LLPCYCAYTERKQTDGGIDITLPFETLLAQFQAPTRMPSTITVDLASHHALIQLSPCQTPKGSEITLRKPGSPNPSGPASPVIRPPSCPWQRGLVELGAPLLPGLVAQHCLGQGPGVRERLGVLGSGGT